MPQTLLKDLKKRTEKTIEHLKSTYAGVRTSRAHPALVEDIKVDYFGTVMPLKQLGTVNIPESRQIVITIWDKTAIKAVEKAIQASPLGINPRPDGETIRLTLPELTRERRTELTKLVNKYSEESKISIRNIRREIVDSLKKMEKDSKINEDDLKKHQKEVQDITDEAIKKIDVVLAEKEREIMND
ncbi:MAG: ribosome recycling factor [Synergistaceae bacterium]|jgi:ribosome recycling factor|nr:ribosome recycling factor [Synergistaceae bacterium]